MKTLYIECAMGAAGDMLMAALLELIDDKDAFLREFNALNLPGIQVGSEPSVKCGIIGTRAVVNIHGQEEESVDIDANDRHDHHDHDHHDHDHHDHDHHDHHDHDDHDHDHHDHHDHDHDHHDHAHHHHAGMEEIRQWVNALAVSDKVKADALAVYDLIAQAESHAHGRPVTEIHFHEVGTLDAVADIVGVCMLVERLSPEQIVISPVHVGSGHVRCAHGILPVPAPATAHILRDVPIYGGTIRSELCTPTGAALLKHFADAFGPMPIMRVEATGYGMGKKDFEAANCVRAHLGNTEEAAETIVELHCNLDDMTAEEIGFAQETLLNAGAKDVFTTPIGMKKSRPGVLLTCLCAREEAANMASLMLCHTTTLGVRESLCRRYTLAREIRTIDTEYGPIRVKVAHGYGVRRAKPEYEDVARAACEHNLPLARVMVSVRRRIPDDWTRNE